jgi:UDP-glucose 4-epimerase
LEVAILGGAGYIGSHLLNLCNKLDISASVIDNLSTGNMEALRGVDFLNCDIGDFERIENYFNHNSFDVVIHLSAYSLVSESNLSPNLYYKNNVFSTFNLLEAMRSTNHNKIIFSSTAAVYGHPKRNPIIEDEATVPINAYGNTKLCIERMLEDYYRSFGIDSISLRYFNAAGADPSGKLGEKHDPETHLIPNILRSFISNKNTVMSVFGDNYPTPDGTCIRDYIHVNDLAAAHILAADYLMKNSGARTFNLGIGKGYSVLEIFNAAKTVTGHNVDYKICDRRPGDPAILVADATAARRELGWEPEYTTIESIIETAWNWHKNGEKFG